jgi:hypothetical protein
LVTVSASGTLVDPYRAGSFNEMGLQTIENRLTALPGRSMQDLVNSEPGWLYEGNAVLHPRGSEYQTQFIVDGIPLTDNRSPSFGPELEADDVESLKIYTAGIPAEYGRKMGGVIEVNTLKGGDPGFHGQLTLFGGTYDTAGINTQDQYAWKANTFGLHFPDSQDQRQTIRGRLRYQVAPRLWIAMGGDYNSGLPFQPDLTAQQYATEYGQVVINHLNFNRDRICPYLTENFSVGADLYQLEKRSLRLQADAQNLSNELEVIDFGGLFSGNALGPSRQYTVRLVATF